MNKSLAGLFVILSMVTMGCYAQTRLEDDADLAGDGLCHRSITIADNPTAEPRYLPEWAIIYPRMTIDNKVLQCGNDNKPLRASAAYRSKDDFMTVSKFTDTEMKKSDIRPIRVHRGSHGIVYHIEEICQNISEINIEEVRMINSPSETRISYQVAFCSHL